jgi:hypothetical protein
VVHGAVRVTHGPDIPMGSPAITDYGSSWFDPFTYIIHQCGGGTMGYRHKESPTGFTFDTAKHPLPPNRVSPMVLTSSEFAFVDISTVLLGPPIFSEQPSKKTDTASLQ